MNGLFSSLLNLISGGSAQVQQLNANEIRSAVGDLAAAVAPPNNRIRLYVDSGGGKGQQMAAVRLLDRLLAPVNAGIPGLGFVGTVDMVYEDRAVSTLTNLVELLGWPVGRTSGQYGNAAVTLIPFSQRGTLDPAVTYGFSGASDPNTITAADLKVTYYLRLQPFQYSARDELVFSDGTPPLDLSTVAQLGGPSFHQRGVYIAPPALPFNWDPYLNDPNPDKARRAGVLQWLIANMGAVNPFRLLVVYGVTTDDQNALGHDHDSQVAEIVLGAMASQRTMAGAGRPGALPIVIVNLSRFEALDGVTSLLDKGLTPGEGTILRNPENRLFEMVKATIRARYDYLDRVKAPHRTSFLVEPTDQQTLTRVQGWLFGAVPPAPTCPTSQRVLWVQLGPIPPGAFDYVLFQSTLPPVFEGNNTANVALNSGRPYYHANRPGSRNTLYPSLTLAQRPADRILTTLQAAADQVTVKLGDWGVPATGADYPPEIFGAPIAAWQNDPTSPVTAYFTALRQAYSQPANDKFSLALAYLAQRSIAPQSQLLARTADGGGADPDPLDALYTVLQSGYDADKQTLDVDATTLPATFGAVLIAMSATNVDLASATLARDPANGPVTSITAGGTTSFLGHPAVVALVFSAPHGALNLAITWTWTETGQFGGLDWIQLSDPTLMLTVYESGGLSFGHAGATVTVGSEPITLSWRLASPGGGWLVRADIGGEHPPSLTDAFQLAAGRDLTTTLPAPLNAIAKLALAGIEVDYDPKTATTSAVTFVVRSQDDTPVPLVGQVSLGDITIITTVQSPTEQPSLAVEAGGRFTIAGLDKDPAVIDVGVATPDLTFTGSLQSGNIGLVGLLTAFAVTTPVDLPGDPQLTEFAFSYNRAQHLLSVSVALGLDWSIPPSSAIFTIEDLSLQVTSAQAATTVNLLGRVTLLKDSPSPVKLDLGADYLGAGAGWTFSAKETDKGVNLGALLHEYLGWAIEQDLAIGGLGFTATTGDGSWLFTGETVGPWTVPFIALDVKATARVGYNGTNSVAATLPEVTSSSLAAAEPVTPGPFGRVEVDLAWNGFDITVWYDYAPKATTYGITWGDIQGTVSGPDANQDYLATLALKDGVTVGSLIEDLVSKLRGSRFSLEAPWSILDDISLAGVALTYTFNGTDSSRNAVGLKVSAGPIDLGFARIDSIDVQYRSTGADRRGVMVTLTGSFPWNVGGANGDTSSLGPWDASEPGAAPAPPGQGGKYLDLRMLGMGQHIGVTGLTDAQTVQQAIERIETLPLPAPGKVPGVVYDAGSDWFIAADLGILRQDDDKSTTYLIALQLVFNDPRLYGLRVKLDGDAAKVLKGLDFEVMYRQITDTLGVYQGEITLPDVMRYLSVGAYSLTLPVFGFAVYTNGDFLIDVGFPHNMDWSRSLTVQGIVYPGIPVTGSAGFYFGELPAAATNKVPAADNGTFNPVVVFGFALQVGVGKSVQYGPLSAGFSITVVGVLEGVIAKWNPYPARLELATRGSSDSQVQGAYYFWLQGTVGIAGQLYGSVDFAIVKAQVNVSIGLYVQLTYESFVSLAISVIASVDVSVTVKVDLWLFSLNLHFSFSMRLKETFTLDNHGTPPWLVSGAPPGTLRAPADRRLRARRALAANAIDAPQPPDWTRLAPTTDAGMRALTGQLLTGLAAAQDEWQTAPNLAAQLPCYVTLMSLDSVAPAGQGDGADEADTSFEKLAKRMLGWALAAVLPGSGPIAWGDLQAMAVSQDELTRLIEDVLLSTDTAPTPWADGQLDTFMGDQFHLTVSIPATASSSPAAVFPLPPGLALSAPAYGPLPALSYTLAGYNQISATALAGLRAQFAQMLVQTEQESGAKAEAVRDNGAPSVAAWVFGDYFLLIARQMAQAARDALRSFAYPLSIGATTQDAVTWVAHNGATVAVSDLLLANAQAPLATGSGNTITVGIVTEPGRSTSFADLASTLHGVDPVGLALANAPRPVLATGAVLAYPGRPPYTVPAGATLVDAAVAIGVDVGDLIGTAGLVGQAALLSSSARVLVPAVTHTALAADTFTSLATSGPFAGCFTAGDLATANAGRPVLRVGTKVTVGIDTHVVADGESLADVARALGIALSALVADTSTLGLAGLIAPGAVLVLPPFTHTVAAGDTLESVAAAYGTSVAVLADSDNAGATFAVDATHTTLAVPHLDHLGFGALVQDIQSSNGLAHLSGMVSRYQLHGLRLPTAGITPQTPGMWVHDTDGQLSLPPEAGLHALTGQMFPVPVVQDEDYVTTLDRNGVSWMTFVSGETPVDQLTVTIASGSREAQAISALTNWLTTTRLDVAVDHLGAAPMASVAAASYPFTASQPWQATDTVALPYGPTPPGVQAMRLWQVPDALQALPNPATRAVNPRVAVLVDRYDEATGATVSNPIGAHGWGSAVTVAVKRVPAMAGSRASQTTYEVVGADGKNLLLLERLLDQLQGEDSAVAQIALGYAPDASSSSSTPGIQTDPLASMTLGIAQADLSTVTNPPPSAPLAEREHAAPTGHLLNTPTELLRLVWEASITRSSGFYLYYYDGDTAAGLPDRIFNDRGETEITLLVLYSQSGRGFAADEVTDYMNVLITGAPLDLSNAVVVARSDPTPGTGAPSGATVSLGGIATGTFSDLGELATANPTLPLRAGAELPITQGVYQAPLGGIALADVATRFTTTVAALQAANGGALPDPIFYPAALRLPNVTLTSTGSGDTATLAALSAATGEDLTALGADLADVAGLFADGGQIVVTGGPRVRTATVPPGAASFGAQRAVPTTAPSDPTDPTFAPLFLEHSSSLLGIAIAANAGFAASGPGLPAGPTYQRDDPTTTLRDRDAAGEDQPWSYAASIPYATYVRGAGTVSPYHGVGQILQVDFAWQDAYGNRVVTTLAEPQTGDRGPANQPPLLAGYSDALIALSQWPSTSASWTMSGGPTAPAIDLLLNFATARYEGVLLATATAATTVSVVLTATLDPDSAATTSHYTLDGGVTVIAAALQLDGVTVALTVSPALTQEQSYTLTVAGVATTVRGGDVLHGHAGFAYPDVPDQRTSSVAADATHDLGVYTRLVGQLQDPLGVALALDTSLLDAGRVALPQGAVAALMAWLGTPTTPGSVLAYLTDRAAQHDTVHSPAATTTLSVPLAPAGVTNRQLFELTTSLVITRTGGTVLGDLATVAGIRETATAVAPLQQPVDDEPTLGLVAFADAFEQVLSLPGDHAYKVATGIDRAQSRSTSSGVWAVRLGLASGEGIRFTVAPAESEPVVFSPRPAATSLIHPSVSIKSYVRGQGLAPHGVPMQFPGIDFDTWCRQLFDAVDGVLSPGLTAPIQILGGLVGIDYLATLLDQKEALAAAAKLWMVPVFEDQANAYAGDAQEAFYQHMLSRLSDAYAIRAAVQLDAAVTADVNEPLADQPPRLFGPVVPSTRVFLAATVESQLATAVTLSFSGPLSATPAGQSANYVVSGGVTVSAAVLSSDDCSVTVTTTTPVVPGTTTVTVAAAVVTTNGEPLMAPLVRTVMPPVSTVATSTITLSSPKLTLATAAAQPLTFLVTAPDVTRGADGEVIPSLTLDLEYDGSSIEHQIGSLAGIEGYLASSWLSFVTAAGTEPLRAELGPIEVPLPLRAFPATPTLTEQSGTGPGAPQDPLDQRTRWEYRATYQLPFHYPQDVIHGRVEFNLRDRLAAHDGFQDAVAPIAQLVSVLPALQADLDGIVATIDATTTTASDGQTVADAKIAMDALTAMLTDIVTAVGDHGLTAAAAAAPRVGTESLTYHFEIAESAVTVGTTQGAQLVRLTAALPPDVGEPNVDIPGWTAHLFEPTGAVEDDVRHFVYARAGTGGTPTYLLNADAQKIPQRTLVLPGLGVLARQDAQTTIWLQRNRDLVVHRPTADPFVYKTPEVTFTNPLHPTVVAADPFDIGSLSSASAPLADHLTNLLTALLVHNLEPELTFQLEVTYAYSLNASLSAISLPVFLQPPLTVTTGQTTGINSGSVQAMAADWAAAITTWFTGTVPLGNGNLQLDLTILSNLTAKPMPLLGLPALYLPLSHVSPPLPTRSS